MSTVILVIVFALRYGQSFTVEIPMESFGDCMRAVEQSAQHRAVHYTCKQL